MELIDKLCIMYKDLLAMGKKHDEILTAWKEQLEPSIYTAFLEIIKPDNINCLPIFDQLRQYIDAGFNLYAKESSFFVNWKKDGQSNNLDNSKIKTLQELEEAINNGIKRFTFRPMEQNYICFDLDEHKDKASGRKQFDDFLATERLDQIPIFKDFPNNFPVYTKSTTGNGLHIYFNAKYLTATKIDSHLKVKDKYLTECEIKYNRQDLTAGGSVKDNKNYVLHGDLAQAPNFPSRLIAYISKAPEKEPKPIQKHYTKNSGNYSLNQLIEWTINDNKWLGSNDTAYKIGYRIGNQYKLEDIVQQCSFLLRSDFSQQELTTALQSGIKNSKY